MSTTVRSARLRHIWTCQTRMNATRAELLAAISDEEHFRFATLYPLPAQDDDEVRALMPSKEEVLEAMRSGGMDSLGWGDGEDFSGYHAEPLEADPWSDESSWGESDYASDEEDGRGSVETGGDWGAEAEMDKLDDDSGVEIYSSDDSRCSPDPTASIDFPVANTDLTSPESPPSPTTSIDFLTSNRTFTCDISDSYSDSPESPSFTEPEEPPQPPEPPPTTSFTPAALNGPITAETLLTFEDAYTQLYSAGASVWRSARRIDNARYEGFLERRHQRGRMGPSKLRDEVLAEELEGWEWMAGWG